LRVAYGYINDRNKDRQEEAEKISKTSYLPWTFFPVIYILKESEIKVGRM
jgi:hypothetical protein